MHSWIFRHRRELGQLYGIGTGRSTAQPLPRAGARSPEGASPQHDPRQGQILRRQRYVLVHPMPRRRA